MNEVENVFDKFKSLIKIPVKMNENQVFLNI